MFNLSFGELILLGAIGLIFVGPKQLPQIAKVLGRTLGELRKAVSEVTSTMTTEFKKDHAPRAKPQIAKVDEKPLEKVDSNDVKPGGET